MPPATFDKKKYRENKYGNRGKLNKWREEKEKSAVEDLRRITGKNIARRRPKLDKQNRSGERRLPQVAQERLDENKAAKEATEKAKRERAAAAAEYVRKKADKFKKLSKRTKRGQPLMKDRMEMLLEEIQKSV